MLVPFNQKDMEKFFLDLAKSLKNQIFRNPATHLPPIVTQHQV